MKQFLLIIGLFIGLTGIVRAQCPTVGFTLPDSICVGSTFTPSNTSTGVAGLSFDWNFHIGDINNTPVTNVVGSYGASVNSAYGTQVLNENGNFYMFVQNNNGNLVRYDFGNALTNTPVENILGNMLGNSNFSI